VIRKLAGWAVLAFAVFYLATDPVGAAHAARGVMSYLHTAGASLSVFVSRL
jgi:hypothetical protein